MKLELQLAALQHEPVLIAEHGNQHFPRERRVRGLPVDVEEVGVGGSRSILQHIEPPRIVGAHDAHVVGHHVEDMSHAVLAQPLDEALEIFRAADLGVERVVIDDVVAVRAARPRAEIRRAIHVAHAETRQIRDERGRIGKSEAAVQLQAIGAARNAHARSGARRMCRFLRRPDARELFGERAEALVALDLLQRERKLPPPVGLLFDGARQVRLVAHAEHVLELNREQARRRVGEIRVERARELGGHRRGDRRDGQTFRQQLRALERERKPRAVLCARDDVLLAHLFGGKQTKVAAELEVVTFPEAGERREIVRRGRNQGVDGVILGRLEIALLVALEIEQAVGQHACAREAASHFVGHRAQILADDHAAIAVALEREDREQVLERVMDVRAFGGGRVRRDPVEPREPHHVIDAQARRRSACSRAAWR